MAFIVTRINKLNVTEIRYMWLELVNEKVVQVWRFTGSSNKHCKLLLSTSNCVIALHELFKNYYFIKTVKQNLTNIVIIYCNNTIYNT